MVLVKLWVHLVDMDGVAQEFPRIIAHFSPLRFPSSLDVNPLVQGGRVGPQHGGRVHGLPQLFLGIRTLGIGAAGSYGGLRGQLFHHRSTPSIRRYHPKNLPGFECSHPAL
jgi:hypothetical protein